MLACVICSPDSDFGDLSRTPKTVLKEPEKPRRFRYVQKKMPKLASGREQGYLCATLTSARRSWTSSRSESTSAAALCRSRCAFSSAVSSAAFLSSAACSLCFAAPRACSSLRLCRTSNVQKIFSVFSVPKLSGKRGGGMGKSEWSFSSTTEPHTRRSRASADGVTSGMDS